MTTTYCTCCTCYTCYTYHPRIELLHELRGAGVMLRHPHVELVRKGRWVQPHGDACDLGGHVDLVRHSLLRLLGEYALQNEAEGSVLEGADAMPVDNLVGGDGCLQHRPKVIGAVGEVGVHRYASVCWVGLVYPHDRRLGRHGPPQLLLTGWRAEVVGSLAGHPRGGGRLRGLGQRVRYGAALSAAAHEGDHRLCCVDDRTEVRGVGRLGACLRSHVVDIEPHPQRRDEATQGALDGAALVLAGQPVVRDEAVGTPCEQRPCLHGRRVASPAQHVLCGALLEDVA